MIQTYGVPPSILSTFKGINYMDTHNHDNHVSSMHAHTTSANHVWLIVTLSKKSGTPFHPVVHHILPPFSHKITRSSWVNPQLTNPLRYPNQREVVNAQEPAQHNPAVAARSAREVRWTLWRKERWRWSWSKRRRTTGVWTGSNLVWIEGQLILKSAKRSIFRKTSSVVHKNIDMGYYGILSSKASSKQNLAWKQFGLYVQGHDEVSWLTYEQLFLEANSMLTTIMGYFVYYCLDLYPLVPHLWLRERLEAAGSDPDKVTLFKLHDHCGYGSYITYIYHKHYIYIRYITYIYQISDTLHIYHIHYIYIIYITYISYICVIYI